MSHSIGSRRSGIFAAILLLVFSVGMSACTRKAKEANVINIGNGGEVKDLDPHITTGVPEFHIMHNILEGLVSKHPKTLEVGPGVAESWTVSKDLKTYTFKIRKNAKWSNGDPVTAKDFVYSWKRLLEPKTAAEYAYQAFYIVNAKEFNEGKLKDASKLGFKALDDYTFEVKLVQPTPFFLGLLFHHSLYPVHQATVEKHGQRWTRPENFVSNGAFKVDAWVMNKVISLKPNPHYWDKDTVKIAGANFFPVEKQETEEKMFRAGELHVTNEVPIERIPTWQADKSGVYHQHPLLATYFYWINTAKKPLDDIRVRKALALAIDRDRLVKYVTRAGQLPGTTLTPPGTAGYQPTPRLPADGSGIPQAKKLLAEAGYPDGKGMPPIELLYNTSDNHKKIAEALQQMWKENLGVDVKLFNQEWKVYLNTQHSKNFQLSRAGWVADYNDPNTFLDMFVSHQQTNYSNWNNKEYDKFIALAATETDAKKRLAYFGKAEDLLLEELPCIPLYIYSHFYLMSKDVEGWYDNIEDIHPLKWVRLSAQPTI